MKIKLILFFLSLYVISCNNNNEKVKEMNTRTADSIEKAINTQIEEEKTACQNHLRDTSFSKLFKAFCPGDTMTSPMICSFKKNPFDTTIIKQKDTIIYSFKVSNICCSKYYANYKMNNDTLILSYNFCGDECDCDCDYILTYKVPTKIYKYKHVVFRTNQEPKGFTK